MQSKDDLKNVRFLPIMIAIFFGSFVSTLSVSTINIAIPVLQNHFDAGLSTVQWTLTGFMLAMGTFAPITGYFGERFSYKRLYIFSLAGFTAASILCALAWDIQSLIAFRILQGAFSGIITPTTMSIIYQVIPREKQPLAISFWAVSSMLAPAIGPTFSGWLLDNASWQWLFWMNVPFGIIGVVLIIPFIPYYRLNIPKSFDLIGLVTVVISSSSLLVALSQGHSWGWTTWKTITLFIVGIVFLALFIWRELTAETPLLDLRVLQNCRYTISLIVTIIITISLYSGTFLTPVFLQNIQHVSTLDTGLILLPASLIMAITVPFIGKLYNSVGPRVLLLIGVVLMAAGTLPLSWLSVDIPHGYIVFWMIVRNLGIAFAMMPASNAGMELISRHMSGHASSISNWTRNVFGSFAIAIFTSMLSSRSVSHAADLVQSGATDKQTISMLSFTMSVNDVYLVATIIVLAALPISLWIRKVRPSEASEKQAAKEATASA
ncbi:MDR family MFS transporter [Paenibacillus mendelii]|uniref:MDR family MFS transporter n=1 Tax=Paenibacillus mendelii TaxID=206163 RepID=A0ABV6J3Z3_9BACL|nr:MDR family MFS transporter [Paenibacillus mendelii]MCQ6561940.1 multidrug efflux MFS transporter [Paenibacillus mendelii]